MNDNKTSSLLPAIVVLELQKAAQTKITPSDPLARIKAIERASARARRNYPQFFK